MHLRPFLAATVALLFAFFLAAPAARAMSVVPPTFPELVAEAQSIIRGEVTSVRSAYDEAAPGRPIKTYVTFRVERTLKGPPSADGTVTLVFLGGKVGADSMVIAGMPKFQTGDREIVFVERNGEVLCPLIAAEHGRYRVLRDPATRRDYIARGNRVPLESTEEVVLPLDAPAAVSRLKSAARALSPEAFEASVAQTAAAQAAAAPASAR